MCTDESQTLARTAADKLVASVAVMDAKAATASCSSIEHSFLRRRPMRSSARKRTADAERHSPHRARATCSQRWRPRGCTLHGRAVRWRATGIATPAWNEGRPVVQLALDLEVDHD